MRTTIQCFLAPIRKKVTMDKNNAEQSDHPERLNRPSMARQKGQLAETHECVIMFIDIVGYSTYASRHSDEKALQLVRRFENTVRAHIGETGGKVIMTAGDAVLASWDSTEMLLVSLHCALSINRQIKTENQGLPRSEQIRIRTGIHKDRVMRLNNGDLIGHGVNLASRLQTAAKPYEILISYSSIFGGRHRSDMPGFSRIGLMRLKGIELPEDVYRVEERRQGKVIQWIVEPFGSPMKFKTWSRGSWLILVIGVVLGMSMAVSPISADFPNPALTAIAFLVLFAGWSLQWAAYRPRTISFWHPVIRGILLILWAAIVLPIGALLGCWPA